MAKINLAELMKEKAGISVEFTSFIVDETGTGQPLIRLTLKNPIAKISGSQIINDTVSGDSLRNEAVDVTELVIGKSTIDDIKKWDTESQEAYDKAKAADPNTKVVAETVFDVNEDGSGIIKSDKLFFDVSQAGEGWITSVKFAAFVRNQQQERRNNNKSGIVSRLRERQTKGTFKDTNVAANKNAEAVA